MNGESDGADRIFLGGVPYYFSEAQMKELLESFGYVIPQLVLMASMNDPTV